MRIRTIGVALCLTTCLTLGGAAAPATLTFNGVLGNYEANGHIMRRISKPRYRPDARAEMTTWFKANAVPIERVLVGWTGIPSLAVLTKLPASPR